MNVEPWKARKPKGGEDHVGLVRDELALDRKRDFLGGWGDQAGAAWEVDARYEGRLVEGAPKLTCEVKRLWVMHLGNVKERFEIAWAGTFPGLWRLSAGSGVSCVICRRDLVTRLDGRRTLERAM